MGSRTHLLNERVLAREIVRRYGRDTLSYFARRDSDTRFFNGAGTAFLSYRHWHGVALVGADPVGRPEAIGGLIAEFLDFCGERKLTPCFLGASEAMVTIYRAHGLRILKIGEECLLRLPDFDVSRLKRKVRRAERHCRDLGVSFMMLAPREISPERREQANRVSREWLSFNGGAEHGFSMTLGRFPGRDDPDVRVGFAVRNERVIGFLTFVPVYETGGWSLDMMRRSVDAPNGLTEFMIMRAARAFQDDGARFMSLNFAALANTRPVREPPAITIARRLAFDHLSSMFQLKSLFTFNDKFGPEWVSRYAAFKDLSKAPLITLAIIQAEDPIPLKWLP